MISWIGMERLVAEKARKDPLFRSELEQKGRPLLRDARALNDEELKRRLKELSGWATDPPSFREASRGQLSAQAMAEPLIRRLRSDRKWDSDWVWYALIVLWERWQPEYPNFELLDDRIQAGYVLRIEGRSEKAASHAWLEAWAMTRELLDRGGIETIREFDALFRGTQSLFNWVQDLGDALGNASLEDSRLCQTWLDVTSEYLARFGPQEPAITKNMRVAMAEAHARLGDLARADALYEEWLARDPEWGWGYVGWSDLYSPVFKAPCLPKDAGRAEEILKRGLAFERTRDRSYLLERLQSLYEETARGREADAMRKERKARDGNSQENRIAGKRAGPNAPCPCGSGKKLKKCCGSW